MTKRAILYARVSSDDRGNDGRNLDGQIEMGRKYAIEHGYEVVAELAEDDRGASGAAFELPQLNRARDMAQDKQFDVLVAREIDRLSRSLAKQLIVEEELRRAGVRIEYCIERYDDTAEGQLGKHVRAAVAEFERLKIRERMGRGKQLMLERGSVMVSRPSYGYRVKRDGAKYELEVYEPEAKIVRLVFDWYVHGDKDGDHLSTRAIADKLTALNVPKPRSKIPHWSHATVRSLLMNEVYTGRWTSGKRKVANGKHVPQPREDWITIDVPAIIDPEVFAAAQAQRKQADTDAHNPATHDYLLSGRVTCACCDYAYNGSVKYYRDTAGERRAYLYYTHSHDHYAVGKLDCYDYFRAEQVDAIVWSWIKAFLQDPQAMTAGLDQYRLEREQENAPLRARLAVVADLLDANRQQLQRLLDLYLTGDFPRDMLLEKRTRLEDTLATLEKERVALTAHLETQSLTPDQVQSVRDFAARIADGLDVIDGSFAERRRILTVLDTRVKLAREGTQKVAYVRCAFGAKSLPIEPTPSTRSVPARRPARKCARPSTTSRATKPTARNPDTTSNSTRPSVR
jgi:site-specific DNA recombinase